MPALAQFPLPPPSVLMTPPNWILWISSKLMESQLTIMAMANEVIR